MLRVVVATLLLLMIGFDVARAQRGGATVHVLEVQVAYGDEVHEAEFPSTVPEGVATSQFTLAQGLEVRTWRADLQRMPDGLNLSVTPWSRTSFRLRDSRVYVERNDEFRRSRNSNATFATPGQTMWRLHQDHQMGDVSGDVGRELFVLLDVHAPDWPAPHLGTAPAEFLATAMQRFRQRPTGLHADVILSLLRFIPLSELRDDDANAEETLDYLANTLREDTPATTYRRIVNWRPVLRQATLVNAPETLPQEPYRYALFGSLYAVHRFIAESPRHDPRARRLAFLEVYPARREYSYHPRWIELLESGELGFDDEKRDRLIHDLRFASAGRQPGPILVILGFGLSGLIATLLTLRVLARRTMFA